jgi:hypothetical protein
MSDTRTEFYSAASSEASSELTDTLTVMTSGTMFCQAFSNPAANVVIKTSDDTLFRVEDLYLQSSRYVSPEKCCSLTITRHRYDT